MSFDPQTIFPSERSFVLRLHRDAAVADGHICGQLEHIPSGHRYRFESAAELVACLVQAVAAVQDPPRWEDITGKIEP